MVKRSKKINSNSMKNKNSMKNNSRMPSVKLSSRPSFAQKLAAFLLQGVKDFRDSDFSKRSGFTTRHHEIAGVLPFLHMNIKESDFLRMLNTASPKLGQSLASTCNQKNLNKTLKMVDFKCNPQSMSAVSALNKGIVDSINNRYSIRHNGRKVLAKVLSRMTWQVNNNKIPAASLKWSK